MVTKKNTLSWYGTRYGVVKYGRNGAFAGDGWWRCISYRGDDGIRRGAGITGGKNRLRYSGSGGPTIAVGRGSVSRIPGNDVCILEGGVWPSNILSA